MKTIPISPDFSCGILITTVLSWLKENRFRFNYKPFIAEGGQGHLVFKFSGIAPEIILVVQEHGAFEIHVRYRNCLWDIVEEFDVGPAQTQTGRYYCQLCLPQGRKYYPTLSELVHQEALDPLLDWTNETFQTNKWIALFRVKGCTYIKIVEESDLPLVKSREDFIYAFPLVQG
jgi:hypothetical protein